MPNSEYAPISELRLIISDYMYGISTGYAHSKVRFVAVTADRVSWFSIPVYISLHSYIPDDDSCDRSKKLASVNPPLMLGQNVDKLRLCS